MDQDELKINAAAQELIGHKVAISELLAAGLPAMNPAVVALTGGPIASGKTYASCNSLAPAISAHYHLPPRDMQTFYTTLGRLVNEKQLFEEYQTGIHGISLSGDHARDGEAIWQDLRKHHKTLTDGIDNYPGGLVYISGEMLGLFVKAAREDHKAEKNNFRIHHYYHAAQRALPDIVNELTKTSQPALLIDTTMSNFQKVDETTANLKNKGYEVNFHLYVSADRDDALTAMKKRDVFIADKDFHVSHNGFRDVRCGKIYELFAKNGTGLIISALDYKHAATFAPAHLPLAVQGKAPAYLAKDVRIDSTSYPELTLIGDKNLWQSLALQNMPAPVVTKSAGISLNPAG